MKTLLTIEYQNGTIEAVVAQAPEWAKWEKETGFNIQQVEQKLGIWDLMFLGYHATKRNAAGKPVLPFNTWMDTVIDIRAEKAGGDPKVTSEEVSAEQS